MTESIPAAPGWVEQALDEAGIPPGPARDAYMDCIAAAKQPAAPSDLLGAEFQPCRELLLRDVDAEARRDLIGKLERIEAEMAEAS
jgi:hypothetical protein